MMKPGKKILFSVCLLLFLMHHASQKIFHLRIAFADHYLDNLVAMPLLLEVMVVERKWLYGMNDFDLSRLEITIATIYIIFISEWLFSHVVAPVLFRLVGPCLLRGRRFAVCCCAAERKENTEKYLIFNDQVLSDCRLPTNN